ncbi:TraR/DksA family transcriptional regulator [Actinophytocola sp.]|uniref:TraR/DksA family transcriptional regulator n=1 Tax=Actinophytocola sp. TaxID=1872138 RepID=UPI003D6B4ECF
MPHAPANDAARRHRLADHLPALRAMLEHQRRFRQEQLAELDTVLANAAAPTDEARREVAVKVAAAARQALADIDIALALVTNGGYGRCRRCGTDIPLSLLRAIPTSRWCLACRRRRTPVTARIPRRRLPINIS